MGCVDSGVDQVLIQRVIVCGCMRFKGSEVCALGVSYRVGSEMKRRGGGGEGREREKQKENWCIVDGCWSSFDDPCRVAIVARVAF